MIKKMRAEICKPVTRSVMKYRKSNHRKRGQSDRKVVVSRGRCAGEIDSESCSKNIVHGLQHELHSLQCMMQNLVAFGCIMI